MPALDDTLVWDPLRRELDAWAAESKTASLWLRDDDAARPTPALERFAHLTSGSNVPALLAVIPAAAVPDLAEVLAHRPSLDAAVHGYAHANHAPAGRKSEEFPIERGAAVIRGELSRGLHRLRELLGPKVLPLYVPPWNRLSREVAALLPDLGFRALSGFGLNTILGRPGRLREINTHVDIIDWRGSRSGRAHGWLAADLAAVLGTARATGMPAVGILTHHLVHDALAWSFLERLFELTARHPAVRWRGVRELAGGP